jgi:DNA-binding NtrC family response regulator
MTEKRALIVDDDSANRSIWELVLVEKGYDVMTAENVTDGMTHVAENVSLYLIDYHLPDGRGTDIVAHVRSNYPATLIVMVSMDDDADVIREAIRAGGNVFMVKPTSPSIMGQLISEIESGDLNSNARQLINRNGRRTYA